MAWNPNRRTPVATREQHVLCPVQRCRQAERERLAHATALIRQRGRDDGAPLGEAGVLCPIGAGGPIESCSSWGRYTQQRGAGRLGGRRTCGTEERNGSEG